MSKLDWVKELVRAEEQMEESGVVDLTGHLESERLLITESLGLLENLKNEFIESATAFNELKASALGRIKIYGIAKTQADFMLFRNGFKMIFSFSEPGKISIRFNFLAPQLSTTSIPSVNSTSQSLMEEHLLIAKKGPFHEINWTFQEHPINIGALVRYHLSLFIKESAK